jgi:hypothetical protein
MSENFSTENIFDQLEVEVLPRHLWSPVGDVPVQYVIRACSGIICSR